MNVKELFEDIKENRLQDIIHLTTIVQGALNCFEKNTMGSFTFGSLIGYLEKQNIIVPVLVFIRQSGNFIS
jgi:hypothetical protein